MIPYLIGLGLLGMANDAIVIFEHLFFSQVPMELAQVLYAQL